MALVICARMHGRGGMVAIEGAKLFRTAAELPHWCRVQGVVPLDERPELLGAAEDAPGGQPQAS